MFKKTFQKLNNVNTKATYRALNKALSKTNTQYKKDLSKETKVKSSTIAKRLFQKKANSKKLSVSLAVGVQYGLPLSLFKPKIKVIRVKSSRTKKARRYNAVTAILPGESRKIIPGAFLIKDNVAVRRKNNSRLPLERVTVQIKSSAEKFKNKNQTLMKNTFKSEFNRQVKLLLK